MIRHSLAVLQAFEAVGRLGSFTGAAAELGVSQPAVSRHVAALERDLGLRLLVRTTRHCALTAEGRALLEGLSDGLGRIDAALAAARRSAGDRALTISVSPYLSTVWFTPRLLEFMQANPGLKITLTHSYDPPDLGRGEVDIGVNWSVRPAARGIVSELVVPGHLLPVCRADYARRIDPADVGSLLGCQLFHEFRQADWADWFAANGRPGEAPESQQISDTGALRQAALSGRGVCLLIRALVREDLESGRLVAPFPTPVHCGEDYWMSYRREHADRPPVRRFSRWLLKQAAGT